jgi:hypothetical protein
MHRINPIVIIASVQCLRGSKVATNAA